MHDFTLLVVTNKQYHHIYYIQIIGVALLPQKNSQHKWEANFEPHNDDNR
jgi:hypothetical protein